MPLPLIHHAPKSCNFPVLIRVVPTIAHGLEGWIVDPSRSAAEFKRPGNSETAGADGPLALNQQTERHLRNIHGNATIPPGIHGHPGEAPCNVRSNSV